MRELLNGVYDLHIHTSPDVVPRKYSDLELARRLAERGMAGCAIKCHYFDTAARAGLLMAQFPQLDVAGGVTLNRSVGGLNPDAVERSAQAGGRMVWFPTLEALAQADVAEVEGYVHSTGFFRAKARDIVRASQMLLRDYGGKVPGTMEELLKLPGVGRKTANLLLGDQIGRASCRERV